MTILVKWQKVEEEKRTKELKLAKAQVLTLKSKKFNQGAPEPEP